MKPLVCVALVAIVFVRPLGQERMTDGERNYLAAHLHMTQEFVRDATRGLTSDQWLYTPDPLRWSIAQCIDHLARTEEYVVRMLRERVLASDEPLYAVFPSVQTGQAPPSGERPRRMTRADDAAILLGMTDRGPAVVRPVGERPPIEEVAPRSSIDDPQSVLDHFLTVRAATIAYVKTTDDDLRGHYTHVRSLPGAPDMRFHDVYQWLLRMSAHTERHLMQVHEVKQAGGYPKSR